MGSRFSQTRSFFAVALTGLAVALSGCASDRYFMVPKENIEEVEMLNTTTHNIDGKEIKEYLGVVTGEAISGANFVKDFLASIKDFTGGRSGAYEEELSKARNIAFDEMNQKAREMGANGVVGIDIDYGTLGDTGSMLMVSVNGTAIKY